MPQDMPPTGGYAQVQYKRNLPTRGVRPWILMAGVHMMMAWGTYQYMQGTREQRELAREKMWARIYLTPLLQAEEDRDQVRRHWANQAREKELLGDEFQVYHSDRFTPTTMTYLPSHTPSGKQAWYKFW